MTGGQVHQLRFFLKCWIFNDAYKELWINSQLGLQAFLCRRRDVFELNAILLYSPHLQSETCSNLKSACASVVSLLLLCFTALSLSHRQRSSEQHITFWAFYHDFRHFAPENEYPNEHLHVATCSATQQCGVKYVRDIAIWASSCSVSSTQPLQGWCCAGLLFTNQHPKKTQTLLEAMILLIAAITNPRLWTRCNWLISHLRVSFASVWCSQFISKHTDEQAKLWVPTPTSLLPVICIPLVWKTRKSIYLQLWFLGRRPKTINTAP